MVTLFFPLFVFGDIPDLRIGHIVLASQIAYAFAFAKAFSDFSDLSFAEFRYSIFLTSSLAVFIYTILYVFILGSKKKMLWIHAGRVVAFMTNLQVAWVNTKVYKIRKAIGSQKYCILRRLRNGDLPIAVPASCASPVPAFIRALLVYSLPEFIYQLRGKVGQFTIGDGHFSLLAWLTWSEPLAVFSALRRLTYFTIKTQQNLRFSCL